MGRFKTKRRYKYNIKLFIIIIFILLFIYITKNFNILDEELFIKYTLNLNIDNKKSHKVISINNKEVLNNIDPLIYIYNTHQLEEYKSNYIEVYNIKPTVLLGSLILKEYLSKYNINSLVEEENLTDMRNNMNLKYGKSYQVSRVMLEKRKEEYPTLKYFIDIHRDSGIYILDKYAKILLVVGLDQNNYQDNLNLSENLCIKVNDYMDGLCRGVMKKSGKNVNGIYNQDFSSNTILIEVGGNNNSIESVNNTMEVLAKILSDIVKENNEKE